MIEPEPNMDKRGPQLTIASVMYSAILSEICIEFKLMLGSWLIAFPSLQSAVWSTRNCLRGIFFH